MGQEYSFGNSINRALLTLFGSNLMTCVQNPSSSDISTRLSLIEQAKANEPVAWELVFTLYAPLIKRWARSEGVNCPFELDNVCQEVFAKIVKYLSSFQRHDNGGSFRGWLRVITRNHICTQRLGKPPLKTVGGTEWNLRLNQIPFNTHSVNSMLDSVEDADLAERTLVFRRIINWIETNYTDAQQIAFRRVVIDERPAREVAEELNLTPNVVYQIKSRILARIRQVFSDLV
jgi:RNA polymerase sigma-70 factor (ECF subfamily)